MKGELTNNHDSNQKSALLPIMSSIEREAVRQCIVSTISNDTHDVFEHQSMANTA